MVEDSGVPYGTRPDAAIKTYPYTCSFNTSITPSLHQKRPDKMKTKMVIRVFMDSQHVSLRRKLFNMEVKKMSDLKMRAKILKIVVSITGVDKAEFKGSDKSLVEVEGGFDPVDLIEKLRRNACRAVIESVAPVKAEIKGGEAEKKPAPVPATAMPVPPMQWPIYSHMTVY